MQHSLERLAQENERLAGETREVEQLREELRIARCDRADMERAIANYFVNAWRVSRTE